MKTLMVVSPHCDDAELGAAGYIAKRAAQGWNIVLVVGTVGAVTFLHSGERVTEGTRVKEQQAAMEVLGVKHLEVLTMGYDGKLHTYPMGDLVCMLDAAQEKYKPDEVLLPLPSAHQDHKTMWDVGIASTRPSPSKHNPTLIAAYEYPLTGWGDGAEASAFRGGMYIDVSDYLHLKEEALHCYGSQMRGANEQISVEGAKALARLRGVECGCSYAELFHILRLRG